MSPFNPLCEEDQRLFKASLSRDNTIHGFRFIYKPLLDNSEKSGEPTDKESILNADESTLAN